jgi:hypothetical protein
MALDMGILVGGTGILVAAGVVVILVTAPSESTAPPGTFQWYSRSASNAIDGTPSPASPDIPVPH